VESRNRIISVPWSSTGAADGPDAGGSHAGERDRAAIVSGPSTRLRAGLFGFVRRARWLHFASLGALLFLVDAIRTTPERETISVTREIVDSLARTREELSGVPVTAQERPALVAAYVSDEILLREAYARDLHRQDGLVRKRLLELMRFLLVEEPTEPTRSELDDYLGAHREVYTTPPSVTLSHVYFASERPQAPPEAAHLLARLRAGVDFRSLGDPFWLGHRLEGYGEPQLAQLLGREYARNVFALPLSEWSGPITSTRGTHFVRVDAFRPAELPPSSELYPMLRLDWLAAKREEILQKKVDELRSKYDIEITSGVDR
jgi:parvulin-like peptidyl-prolyl isomerase